MRDFKFQDWLTEHHHIGQHFGANPLNCAHIDFLGHESVDIEAPPGAKEYAVTTGEVYRFSEMPDGHNYGIHVRLAHRDRYQTIYANLGKGKRAKFDRPKNIFSSGESSRYGRL